MKKANYRQLNSIRCKPRARRFESSSWFARLLLGLLLLGLHIEEVEGLGGQAPSFSLFHVEGPFFLSYDEFGDEGSTGVLEPGTYLLAFDCCSGTSVFLATSIFAVMQDVSLQLTGDVVFVSGNASLDVSAGNNPGSGNVIEDSESSTIGFDQLFAATYSISACHSGLCSSGGGAGDAFARAQAGITYSSGSLLTVRSTCQAAADNTCPYEYLAGAGAMTAGDLVFTLTDPTPYVLTYSSALVAPGAGQACPVLPDELCDVGLFEFTDVQSGCWIDPPMAEGYSYEMTGTSLFTKILDFPAGIDADDLFTVVVQGIDLGDFGPGDVVDFVALHGAAVSSFEVRGIEPLVPSNDPTAFPLQLEFDTPTASLTMEPIIAFSTFSRGDCNDDGFFDIGDGIQLLSILFGGASDPACEKACDSNDDGAMDIGDGIFILAALFGSGPLPSSPHPTCGDDPSADNLSCHAFLTCP